MRTAREDRLLTANVETPQPFDQLPSELGDSRMAPTPIGIDQVVEQRRCDGGKRHFEVQGEGIVIDSGHGDIRTKTEHGVNTAR